MVRIAVVGCFDTWQPVENGLYYNIIIVIINVRRLRRLAIIILTFLIGTTDQGSLKLIHCVRLSTVKFSRCQPIYFCPALAFFSATHVAPFSNYRREIERCVCVCIFLSAQGRFSFSRPLTGGPAWQSGRSFGDNVLRPVLGVVC